MQKPITLFAFLLFFASPLFPRQGPEGELPNIPERRFALTVTENYLVPQAKDYDETFSGRLKLSFYLRRALAFSFGLEFSEFTRDRFESTIIDFNPAKNSSTERNTNVVVLPIGFSPAGGAETIPLTFSFEYHVQTATKFRPYVGVGIGYFINDYLGSYLGLDLIQVEVNNDIGLVGEVGFHYDFTSQHAIDFTIRFLDQRPRLNLSSEIFPIETISRQGSGLTDEELIEGADQGSLTLIGGDDVDELNLAVFGVSVGYSFRF